MRSHGRALGGGIAILAAGLMAVSCASGPSRRVAAAAAQPSPSPDQVLEDRATAEFRLGREAALAGDLLCARYHFQRAIDAVRPSSGPPPSGPLGAFSVGLYDGILRYEALAGPTEDAGNADGETSPELSADVEAPEASPEAVSAARAEVDAEMPTSSFDVPIVVNDAVLRMIAAFQSDGLHDKIAAGLSRSGRYLPMIHRIFEEEGLPGDLAMIAFIESSFLPHARSPRSAHGIWQFMPRTGRQYGLRTNGVVDERSDPEKATRAAARYLSYLHEIFGDWYLVMAAYNAGEGKILRAMDRTGARDFWELASTRAIRRQTQNYVPAFLASLLIARNPSHYGFEVELQPPLDYETVSLDRPVDLRNLARHSPVTLDDLEMLNPELRSYVTPREPEGYDLKVPSGFRDAVLVAFASAPTAVPPALRRHVARSGDSLYRIARRYGISVSALAAANSLSPRAHLALGQVLMVPVRGSSGRRSTQAKRASRSSSTKVARASTPKTRSHAPNRNYRVKRGDTLYEIALRYGVSVAEILAINGLPGSTIRPGDRLKIPTGGK
jgi:membrane-bound lytic murein transglycosylase D